MAFFDWTPKLETGIPKVDDQHKTLVDAINRLHAAMKQGKAREEIGGVLHFLRDYTVTHFRDEEVLMASNGFPELARHKDLHTRLVAQVDEFVVKFDQGALTISLAVMDFLQDWLQKHIAGEDMRYAANFRERGLKL